MTAVMTCAGHRAEENATNDGYLWPQMMMPVGEESLAGKTVLDHGCDGSLCLLHDRKPFRRGTGADIAWRDIMAAYSNVPVEDFSLDDYRQAFFDAGFAVSAGPLKRRNVYFPRIAGSPPYRAVDKALSSLVRA